MENAVLGFIGSKNIGDYVQTKAVLDIVGSKNAKILDRESLNNYNENKRYIYLLTLIFIFIFKFNFFAQIANCAMK